MGISVPYREDVPVDLAWNEVTGAVGDAATVLPVVVAVAVLTDLTLPVMLVWFGVFQVVWGLYYGVPISVFSGATFALAVALTFWYLRIRGERRRTAGVAGERPQ